MLTPSRRRFVEIVLLIAFGDALAVSPFFLLRSDRSAEVSFMKPRLAHPRLIDLAADPHNANRGTDRGREALARSLRDYGPGRSVLIDRHGTIR